MTQPIDAEVRRLPALQQPSWHDDPALTGVVAQLAQRPGLVDAAGVASLRDALAGVSAGGAFLLQSGDCAESPSESSGSHVARKVGLLQAQAGLLHVTTGLPTVRVGRIGGQYAKPRSQPTELVGDLELPVFRGHLVNEPDGTAAHRHPDPARMLIGHDAAGAVHDALSVLGDGHGPGRVYSSHEALVLDYELPLVRVDDELGNVATSGHLLWAGLRTNAVTGAHIGFLSRVVNPVAVKLGPDTSVESVLALCAALDPHREPGRLTLIARMGAERLTERLPGLLTAVRTAGHAVVWTTDPMHANTVRLPDGRKTRLLAEIRRETAAFVTICRRAGVHPGGLHLEATGEAVLECVDDADLSAPLRSTSLCDPRLNAEQAESVIATFTAAFHG